jgi:hypothetical protein
MHDPFRPLGTSPKSARNTQNNYSKLWIAYLGEAGRGAERSFVWPKANKAAGAVLGRKNVLR